MLLESEIPSLPGSCWPATQLLVAPEFAFWSSQIKPLDFWSEIGKSVDAEGVRQDRSFSHTNTFLRGSCVTWAHRLFRLLDSPITSARALSGERDRWVRTKCHHNDHHTTAVSWSEHTGQFEWLNWTIKRIYRCGTCCGWPVTVMYSTRNLSTGSSGAVQVARKELWVASDVTRLVGASGGPPV